MSDPQPGEVYGHREKGDVWARVVGVSGNSISFEVLDSRCPEWQGGAGMPLDLFPTIYPNGPYFEVSDEATDHSYAEMVNAPLKPRTVEALRKRIAEGNLPTRTVKKRAPQLSAEQELAVRQVIAGRIGRLRDDTPFERSTSYTDGYNEAIRDAVVEIMGGDPIRLPGAPRIEPGQASVRVMRGKYVEDVYLPGDEPEPDLL